MSFNRFEEIESWKLARQLCAELYSIYESGKMKNDFSLWNQINSASGSVMDNIAEGFERDGNKELVQFLSYAKGSCGEVRSQLYRLLDRKYISDEQYNELLNKAEQCSKKINSLMTYIKGSGFVGKKFKPLN